MRTNLKAGREFARLVAIIGRLRSPGGCPWDRKQDVRSITDYFLEEAYETAEACLAGKAADAAEELGDMLMEVVFLSRLFEEKGGFTIADALNGINRKMTGRHPHVFGRAKAGNERQIVDEWQKTKLREKGRASVLDDGLPINVPALLGAFQLGQRAASVGFDWPGAAGVLEKVREEVGEFEAAAAAASRPEMTEEIGDLFFALASLARHLRINPELALRRANRKFAARFRKVEAKFRRKSKDPRWASLDDMEAVWNKLKKRI
jgi:MazG family protein